MYRYESWIIKKAEGWRIDAFWTVVLEKTLESPLYCKEIQPVNPKGNQSCVFTGRTDAEAEAPILWPPDMKNWLIGKDPDAGKDWRQKEKGMTEDEMVGWHHWLKRHEFEWAPGVGEGQGRLVCCSPWGHKELDMTEQLNWLNLIPSKNHEVNIVIIFRLTGFILLVRWIGEPGLKTRFSYNMHSFLLFCKFH